MAGKKPLVAIDLFSGAGGMSLGFKQAGFNVAAAVDFDPIHVAAHATNFPSSLSLHADVAKVSGAELLRKAGLKMGSVDCLFGGPPCQRLSSGGRREAEDERNYLLHHFARVAGPNLSHAIS
jgi:DNA (cytosine-5)-methyltransferase 1